MRLSALASGYAITGTSEVKQRQSHIWLVNLENEYKQITLRVEDNNPDLEEVKTLNK